MSSLDQRALLRQVLSQSAKASDWLQKSFDKASKIDISRPLSESDLDALELLASRFTRLSDLLTNKLFRLIDVLSLESPGSMIDVINRAEKRGISKASDLRKLRELRNWIAHEYEESDLIKLYGEIVAICPALFAAYKASLNFIEKNKLLTE